MLLALTGEGIDDFAGDFFGARLALVLPIALARRFIEEFVLVAMEIVGNRSRRVRDDANMLGSILDACPILEEHFLLSEFTRRCLAGDRLHCLKRPIQILPLVVGSPDAGHRHGAISSQIGRRLPSMIDNRGITANEIAGCDRSDCIVFLEGPLGEQGLLRIREHGANSLAGLGGYRVNLGDFPLCVGP